MYVSFYGSNHSVALRLNQISLSTKLFNGNRFELDRNCGTIRTESGKCMANSQESLEVRNRRIRLGESLRMKRICPEIFRESLEK